MMGLLQGVLPDGNSNGAFEIRTVKGCIIKIFNMAWKRDRKVHIRDYFVTDRLLRILVTALYGHLYSYKMVAL
jgi:hypothetical protein